MDRAAALEPKIGEALCSETAMPKEGYCGVILAVSSGSFCRSLSIAERASVCEIELSFFYFFEHQLRQPVARNVEVLWRKFTALEKRVPRFVESFA